MAHPQNHKVRSPGSSPFLLVRADRYQRRLSDSDVAPQKSEPNALVLYPDLSGGGGGQAARQCQIPSGLEPFWLIATVSGGEHVILPEFISTQRKV